MRLSQLLQSCQDCGALQPSSQTATDPDIVTITDDSREAGPGVLFFVTPLSLPFLPRVIESGCAAILVSQQAMTPGMEESLKSYQEKGGSLLRMDPVPQLAGALSSALYDHPSEKMEIVAVTGTNGKTSTAWMAYHIWKKRGVPSGMIGTLGVYYTPPEGPEVQRKTGYTTPRAPLLQQILAEMVAKGVYHVVMEVSSEALSLGRVWGTRIGTALFTNITPDHLDHHGDMETYFQAKMLLIDHVAEEGGRLVIYTGTEGGKKVVEHIKKKSPGKEKLIAFDRPEEVALPVPAHFQKINANLAILGLAGLGGPESPGEAGDLFADLPPIPGRFNVYHVDGNSGSLDTTWPDRAAVVDYAHTPDALETLIREIRGLGARRIITLFGCGGNRDHLKRPLMGEIAGRLSDLVILTNDNPRKESPEKIIQEIRKGTGETSCTVIEISDRRAAIRKGVEYLLSEQCGPVVLAIAGKGHEEVQIFADHTDPFSDTEELRAALALHRV